MKIAVSIYFTLIITVFSSCQQKQELYKVIEGEYDELGAACAYINSQSDTIVPMGKYYYCFTDTLKHFATVLTHNSRCIAIDALDNELFEVYWIDNGPDSFHEGLIRIRKDGLIGFANHKGTVVIEPQYSCAESFKHGRARVSKDCDLVKEGEYSRMKSDEWLYIDMNGITIGNEKNSAEFNIK